MKTWKARRSWSVRGHLAGIVVAVVVVFIGIGAVLGRETWQNSQHSARSEAAYLAAFGAGEVADSAAIALGQAQAIAANPAAAPLLSDPTTCSLDFKLTLFPGSHLDLVRPDGAVACSSADLPAAGSTHAGASWLQPAEPGQTSEIFVDGVTGLPVDCLCRPCAAIRVVSLASSPLSFRPLASPRWSPTRTADLVTTRSPSWTSAPDCCCSSSLDRPPRSRSTPTATDPLPGYLASSEPVKGTTWTLVAGGDPETVLASTRSVLLRGGLLGGCVLLVLIGAMLIVNRRIGRPLRELTSAVGGTGTAWPRVGIDRGPGRDRTARHQVPGGHRRPRRLRTAAVSSGAPRPADRTRQSRLARRAAQRRAGAGGTATCPCGRAVHRPRSIQDDQ